MVIPWSDVDGVAVDETTCAIWLHDGAPLMVPGRAVITMDGIGSAEAEWWRRVIDAATKEAEQAEEAERPEEAAEGSKMHDRRPHWPDHPVPGKNQGTGTAARGSPVRAVTVVLWRRPIQREEAGHG